jgi:pullulanase
MKQLFIVIMIAVINHGSVHTQTFSEWPFYEGNDLGLSYSKIKSEFRVWSPVAEEAHLLLYKDGAFGHPEAIIQMNRAEHGVWMLEVAGDLLGKFYAFTVKIDNRWSDTVPDPYAKAVGVNGKRAQVIDLSLTNPEGWQVDAVSHKKMLTESPVIYELHVRDASIHHSSGIRNKGKFLGLTERGTVNDFNQSTGLTHIKELGVTHVHLLPCFDYYTVDETNLEIPQYNWGYDPMNYNTPEGSYSTNPYEGSTRIREMKEMVKAFHDQGLRVVLDVVYNHTMFTESSLFNQLVPGYYYRQTEQGGFSNASGCNNETASERQMMRKFMIESLSYWVNEFHVDGFRFDLMGIHDIPTMNAISSALKRIHPGILLYGEGWTAGASPLPEEIRAVKHNVRHMPDLAVFSDDARNAIKGSVFEHREPGFVSGAPYLEQALRFGIVASCSHPQVEKQGYADNPMQIITYCECHDNHILWDKLAIVSPLASDAERQCMQELAFAIVLTSQGIPFFTAGSEFLRTKKGVENSFKSPDSINAIDWNLKGKNISTTNLVANLIKMRKEHPSFRLKSATDLSEYLHFSDYDPAHVVSYELRNVPGDSWRRIFVAFNGQGQHQTVHLPEGEWKIAISKEVTEDQTTTKQDVINLSGYGFTILYQE